MMANTWQGEFPWQNLLTDGYPAERFPRKVIKGGSHRRYLRDDAIRPWHLVII